MTVSRSGALRLALLFALSLAVFACTPRDDDDDETTSDDDTGDDDSSIGDDDTGDDDDSTADPPVFLAAYDFSLVMLENKQTNTSSAIHGEMDVYVSTTAFEARLATSAGVQWDWSGALVQNEQSFNVFGQFGLPGMDDFYVRVQGNFMRNTDGTPSPSCLTGIGRDDDFNAGELGIQFAWYGCQVGAEVPQPAAARATTYNVTVTTHGDNCGGYWTTNAWSETWQFDGRKLVVSRGGYAGWAPCRMTATSSGSPCWSPRARDGASRWWATSPVRPARRRPSPPASVRPRPS